MQELLKQLYGENATNAILKLIFESLIYFVAGCLGSFLRSVYADPNMKLKQAIGYALSSMLVITILANWLKTKITDQRLIFGLGVVLAAYFPNILRSIKNGSFVRAVAGLFSDKAKNFVDDLNCSDTDEDASTK